MDTRIVSFIKSACEKYGMTAYFIPSTGVYTLLKKGKAVQNFNQEQFYTYPKKQRMRDYRALINVGLVHNLGESYKDQLVMPRKWGKKIA